MMEEAGGRVVAMVAEARLIPSEARSWFVSAVTLLSGANEGVLRSPDTCGESHDQGRCLQHTKLILWKIFKNSDTQKHWDHENLKKRVFCHVL